MWVSILVAIGIIGIALIVYIADIEKKKKMSLRLDDWNCHHDVSAKFICPNGYLAFCDDEQIVYHYMQSFEGGKPEAIRYGDIISYKIASETRFISFCTISFNEVHAGDIGHTKCEELERKLSSIIEKNKEQTEKAYMEKYHIPDGAVSVTVQKKLPNKFSPVADYEAFAWVKEGELYLLGKFDFLRYHLRPETCRLTVINKKDVVVLTQEGDVQYVTETQGGGGGGSSIGGAIVGGLLAGVPGAIIGSREQIEPILSTTKKIDDRVTKLKMIDSYNRMKEILFEYDDYYLLAKLLEECKQEDTLTEERTL